MNTTQYSSGIIAESEETRRGEILVAMLGLKPKERRKISGSQKTADFYRTQWGAKTALGLFRSVAGVVEDGE